MSNITITIDKVTITDKESSSSYGSTTQLMRDYFQKTGEYARLDSGLPTQGYAQFLENLLTNNK